MITQKITWWLWNQMFQYAYIKALALRNSTTFSLDVSWFDNYNPHKYGLECFAIVKKYATGRDIPFYTKRHNNNKYINMITLLLQWICKRCDPDHFLEKWFNFDKHSLQIKNGYIEWYFQTEKYFKDYEDQIRKDFIFIHEPNEINKKIIQTIWWINSISVHIRRGDYLQWNNVNYHWICSIEYYKKAIEYIKEHVENPIFYFFSDDIERVKKNITSNSNTDKYINHNTWTNSWEDMRLMSHCKHNIIANSSFSWRGARLNNNSNKIVIAPKKWFATQTLNDSDIIPEKWIKL